MRPLSSEINDIRPLTSIASINKLIALLERRKTVLTPALDFTICCMINNVSLELYYHEQLVESIGRPKSKIQVSQGTLNSILDSIDKNKKAGLLSPGNHDDPINVAIKLNKRESSNRSKVDEDFEYGLSDW